MSEQRDDLQPRTRQRNTRRGGHQPGSRVGRRIIATYDALFDIKRLIRHKWRIVKITKQATDEAVLKELGGRLARVRLDRNLTQAELAEQAGVSKRTISRIESGSVATQLSSLVRVCRVLDIVERFDLIVTEPVPSPVEQLKLHGRKRQRASTASAVQNTKASAKKWRWGDEE